MNRLPLFAALLLALPVAVSAQTTPASKAPATKAPAQTTPAPKSPTTTTPTSTTPVFTSPAPQQTTEVTEELDPVTGRVIRRTTRTIPAPAGGTAPTQTSTSLPTVSESGAKATDAQVTAFLRKKTTVATLTAPALLDAYNRFMDRVHNDRQNWKATDWANAAAVLSSLNSRYDQLRSSFSFDDKVTIRSQQAEFQGLRTARQLSDQVSDKL